MLKNKGPLNREVAAFSILEVLFALGVLGLVLSLLFQGLGQIEAFLKPLEQKQALLAVKEALRRELTYNPGIFVGKKFLKEEPLCYLSFSHPELGLAAEKGITFSQYYKEGATFVVYASPLEGFPGASCVYLDLRPLSLRGTVGELVYSFPFCF